MANPAHIAKSVCSCVACMEHERALRDIYKYEIVLFKNHKLNVSAICGALAKRCLNYVHKIIALYEQCVSN